MTVHSLLSPRLTRGRKKAGHINQMYIQQLYRLWPMDRDAKKPAISIRCIWPALTRSRVKRGSYMVFDLFYRDITDLFNRCLSFSR